MSSSLVWQIVSPKNQYLSDEVKFWAREYYEENIVNVALNHHDLPVLRAAKIAGVVGMQDLIDLIEAHGEIRIKEEW
jgi:hypothetical protein